MDDLRARIDAAVRPVLLVGLQDAELDGPAGMQRICEWADWISETAAAESTGLVDALRRQCESAVAENRQLRARLREHDACRVCGHERRQHGRDPVIRRDWCSGCKTSCDLPAFQPVEETLS